MDSFIPRLPELENSIEFFFHGFLKETSEGTAGGFVPELKLMRWISFALLNFLDKITLITCVCVYTHSHTRTLPPALKIEKTQTAPLSFLLSKIAPHAKQQALS